MTREEAIEFIAQSVKSDVDMAKVADAIKALEQEKTGYWIKYDEGYYVVDRLEPVVHSIRECSECHTKIADFCGELKYCPNCKTRMERVVNDKRRKRTDR